MNKKTKQISWWLVAAVVISLVVIWPLFRRGFWESDDGEWMVIRFSAFHESLRNGHVPVRWVERLNHGYGYPVMNFLYPLPFYLAELPYLAGFDVAESIKIVFGGSVVLSAVGMFLFARKWGNIAAFVSTAVYLFAPYRMFLLYTRGSLGESVALASVPFVFLFAERLVKSRSLNDVIGLGLSYAALIMSHNVIALLFTPVLILYMLTKLRKEPSNIPYVLHALLLGLSLSAFFWFPALWDLQYTRAGGIRVSEYADYFLNTRQLASMLGPAAIVFVSIAAIKRQWFFAALAATAAFLMHPVSSPLLAAVPLIEKIQFPWRMATVWVFSAATCAGIAMKKSRFLESRAGAAAFLGALVLLVTALPQTANVRFVEREEGFYTTNDDTTTVKNEFTPKWVTEDPGNKPEGRMMIFATEGSYQILRQEFRTARYDLQIRLHENAKIRFNTHYFPGWKVYVDDERIALNPGDTGGLIEFAISPGQDKLRDVKVVFERTPVRKTAETVSLLTAIAVFSLLVIRKYRKNQLRKSVGIVLAVLALANVIFFIASNVHTYREVFDPHQAESAYLNSQWVNPDSGSNVPIGDSGLYSWAGWKYIHGENPVLINPEMPPLGKYVIGVGLLLTKRPAVVGLLLAAFAAVTHALLSYEILKDRWLAAASTSLLLLEPVFRNLVNITMLDGLQLGFLNVGLLFFTRAMKDNRWFILSAVSLGAMASTKFFASAAAVVVALAGFLLISKKWKKLQYFLLTLPLAGLVHLFSYASFFAHGNDLRGYLGAQKWILGFYRAGNVGTIPPGSYWLLVMFNRWRVWFGQEWGVFTTVASDLWRVSWPVNVFAVAVQAVRFVKKTLPENLSMLIIWLVVYSVFLTFIIGWPHYMLLFLPYSTILLVDLVRTLAASPQVSRLFHLGGGILETPRETRSRMTS